MGKLTATDLETLKEAGVINTKTAEGIKKEGLASERRRSAKRYMKTKDGKWVSPTLYFRGNTDAEPSKKMNEFKTKFNELVQEYTVTKTK